MSPSGRPRSSSRSRWAAIGAAVAVTIGAGGVLSASAAGSANASSFVPITPCRLMDTRPASNIGPRSTPLGAGEIYEALVRGTNGSCTIPAAATAVGMNVTFVNPTTSGFLTVFPAGNPPSPWTSNLNWVGGQAPAPNAVTTPLSSDGKIGVYNLAGSVDVIADVVGYYEPSTSGPAGQPGAPGTPGAPGPPGPQGPQGPALQVPALGRFTPTQIVNSAILTCGGPPYNDALNTVCNALLLNGTDVYDDLTTMFAICNAVTGKGVVSIASGSLTLPAFKWNGSQWVLSSTSGSKATGLNCAP